MLLSLRKNGLTSLFKEVTGFSRFLLRNGCESPLEATVVTAISRCDFCAANDCKAPVAIHPRKQKTLQQGKKEYTPPPWHPSFLGLSPDPEVAEQKKAMVYTIFLGKQGKRVYTIGPERRVYTIEPRKRKKRRVSTVVVYTFFFPAPTFFPDCKNVALKKLPKISLKTERYFGQFKGYIFAFLWSLLFSFASWGSWVTGGFTIVLRFSVPLSSGVEERLVATGCWSPKPLEPQNLNRPETTLTPDLAWRCPRNTKKKNCTTPILCGAFLAKKGAVFDENGENDEFANSTH